MDSYLRKKHNLAVGEKDASVVRASSPQPASRSVSAEPPKRNVSIVDNKVEGPKKVAYKADLKELVDAISSVKNVIEDVKKHSDEGKEELKQKLQALSNQIDNIKADTEQTKAERLKSKLDNFISKYNQNEDAHSNALAVLEKDLSSMDKRIKDVEGHFE